MRTSSFQPLQLLAVATALAAGLGELLALQSWRLRDWLAGARKIDRADESHVQGTSRRS